MKVEFHPLTADDFRQAADFYENKQPGISKIFRVDLYQVLLDGTVRILAIRHHKRHPDHGSERR
jgi:plasmid stabilization system protein ParE